MHSSASSAWKCKYFYKKFHKLQIEHDPLPHLLHPLLWTSILTAFSTIALWNSSCVLGNISSSLADEAEPGSTATATKREGKQKFLFMDSCHAVGSRIVGKWRVKLVPIYHPQNLSHSLLRRWPISGRRWCLHYKLRPYKYIFMRPNPKDEQRASRATHKRVS